MDSTSHWRVLRTWMRRGGGSQRSLPNIQARKPPFGIATRAPSWPKPTVIRSTAPVAVADLLTLLVDLPAAALFSRLGVLFRTIWVPIRWAQRSLVHPAACYSCRTFSLRWSPVFRFELLNLSISSPMNSEAVAFHQM